MELISLKQYADKKEISYEAVRKLVKRHEKDLAGHIVIRSGVRYLDEEAIRILQERRRTSPVVVRVEDQSEELDILRRKLEEAKTEIMKLQQARIADQARIIALQDEVKLGIEAKAEFDAAQAARTAAEARAEELQRQHDADRQQLDQAKAELESFVPSLFGFYRKKS